MIFELANLFIMMKKGIEDGKIKKGGKRILI